MSMKDIILSEYERRFKSISKEVSEKSKELKETNSKLLEKMVEEKTKELEEINSKLGKFKGLEEQRSFIVEKNYSGIRGFIHKKGEEVKVFSNEGEDVTKFFEKALEQAKTLSECDFILDCQAIKSKDNTVFYATDLLYLDNDLTDLPLHKRKNLLKQLNFSDSIKESPTVTARTSADLRKAIELFDKLDRKSGILIKRLGGKYSSGKSDDWIEYVEGGEDDKGNIVE